MSKLIASGENHGKALIWFYIGQAVRHTPISSGFRSMNYRLRWLKRSTALKPS
jgi:hypothetical protein